MFQSKTPNSAPTISLPKALSTDQDPKKVTLDTLPPDTKDTPKSPEGTAYLTEYKDNQYTIKVLISPQDSAASEKRDAKDAAVYRIVEAICEKTGKSREEIDSTAIYHNLELKNLYTRANKDDCLIFIYKEKN